MDKVLMEIVGREATWDGGIQEVFSEQVTFKQTWGIERQQPREKWNPISAFRNPCQYFFLTLEWSIVCDGMDWH